MAKQLEVDMPVQFQPSYLQNLQTAFTQSAQVKATWKVFENDPRVNSADKILIWLCGGAARYGSVVKAAMRMYTGLWAKVEVVVVDYDVDLRYVDDRWAVFDLGDALKNMTLKQVLALHRDVPAKIFSKAELERFYAYVKKNGNHYFSDGAGANDLVGRFGMAIALEGDHGFENYVLKYAMDLKKEVTSERIQNIIVSGAGGGTGRGVRDYVRQYVDAAFRTQALDKVTGAIELILAFRAYSYLTFDKDGDVTGMGPLIWEDCLNDWRVRNNAFFQFDEIGPDGFLLEISHLMGLNKVLNNAPERGGHPNAVLRFREVTPWALQRISAFEIYRGLQDGKLPKLFKVHNFIRRDTEVVLHVEDLRTIGELARARYVLNNWEDILRRDLQAAGITSDQVTNYADIVGLVGAEIATLNGVQARLLQESGGTGFYLHENELDLLQHVHKLPLDKVLAGVASVYLKDPKIEPSIPGEHLNYEAYALGVSRMVFELGKSDGSGNNINVPTFRGITPSEQFKLDLEKGRADMQDLLQRTSLDADSLVLDSTSNVVAKKSPAKRKPNTKKKGAK